MIALLQPKLTKKQTNKKGKIPDRENIGPVKTVLVISKLIHGFTKSTGESLNASSTVLHVNS